MAEPITNTKDVQQVVWIKLADKLGTNVSQLVAQKGELIIEKQANIKVLEKWTKENNMEELPCEYVRWLGVRLRVFAKINSKQGKNGPATLMTVALENGLSRDPFYGVRGRVLVMLEEGDLDRRTVVKLTQYIYDVMDIYSEYHPYNIKWEALKRAKQGFARYNAYPYDNHTVQANGYILSLNHRGALSYPFVPGYYRVQDDIMREEEIGT